MKGAFILLAFICLILLMIIYSLHKQIRSFNSQIRFLRSEDTNMRLTTDLTDRDILMLSDEMNQLVAHFKEKLKDSAKRDREIKETVTGLSHDIRTPLTSLEGYIQLFSMTKDKDEKKKYYSIICNRMDALSDILEEMFTYTRLQEANYELSLSIQDMSQLCFNNVVSFYDDFKSAGIEPSLELPDDPIYILGNRAALKRVVLNMVKNSLMHSNTRVSIQLWSDHSRVYFRCTNDVEHPEEVNVASVFSRFYKGVSAKRGTSTGLGLTIVKGLAEAMNGTATAQLEGNLFSVTVQFPKQKAIS